MQWSVLIVVVGLLSACGSSGAPPSVAKFDFPGATPNAPSGGSLTLWGDLWLPPGDGRVPVMVLSHGCTGRDPVQEQYYGEALTSMGVAMLAIDHLGPRHVGEQCSSMAQVSGWVMMRDAFAALDALAQNPRIDADRAGMFGFSQGGGATWLAALSRFNDPRGPAAHRFKLHVAFYPFCTPRYLDQHTTGAVRILMGANDHYTGVESCAELTKELRAAGGDAEITIYAHAEHMFDVIGQAKSVQYESYGACIFDEQADGQWRERSSGRLYTPGDHAGFIRAAQPCMRLGASVGPDAAARAASMEELKHDVALYLLGKGRPQQ